MEGRNGGPVGCLAAAGLGRYAGLKSTKGGSVARKPASDEAEAEARAINAEPWEPMAGMVKRQCVRCRYFFASPADSTERRCANCVSLGTGRSRAHAPA
jgi:hypothetical protein